MSIVCDVSLLVRLCEVVIEGHLNDIENANEQLNTFILVRCLFNRPAFVGVQEELAKATLVFRYSRVFGLLTVIAIFVEGTKLDNVCTPGIGILLAFSHLLLARLRESKKKKKQKVDNASYLPCAWKPWMRLIEASGLVTAAISCVCFAIIVCHRLVKESVLVARCPPLSSPVRGRQHSL